MPCSRTQHGDACGDRTQDLSIRSPTLYHYATALPTKEEHYTLLQTKYESSGPCGFGEEDFLCFSHDAPGAGPVWTTGARLAGFIKRTTIHCY